MGVKSYVADEKAFSSCGRVRCREKGELKNEGGTHDVIEKKGKQM
jgi:hypothetical protein